MALITLTNGPKKLEFVALGSLFQLIKMSDRKTSGLYYKTFRIVIYDRNDSMIVEPVL